MGKSCVAINITNSTMEIMTDSFEFSALIGNINLVLIILGCLGNSLTILVLGKSQKSYSSTAIYFSALAVSDNIILLSVAMHCYLLQNWNINLRTISVPSCKVHFFLVYASTQASSCLLVAVTLERVISVTFPYNFKTICSPNIARIVVITLWIAIYGANSHFLFGLKSLIIDGQKCEPEENTYMHLVNIIVAWQDLIVTFALPFVVILFGNSLIIYKLTRSRVRSNTGNAGRRSEASLTLTLVIVNIAFLVTVSPLVIILLYIPINISCDPIEDSGFSFWFDITKTLSNLNAVINFYLYFMSGKQFRGDVKRVLTGWFACGRVQMAAAFRGELRATNNSEPIPEASVFSTSVVNTKL